MDRETTGSADLDQQKAGIGRKNDMQQDQGTNQQYAEDISKVDRQEGDMNNGELGGDFKETKINSGSKQ